MTATARRVALVADAVHYVGPSLARMFADRGHDLVLGDPDPDLVAELEATGATIEAVAGVSNLARPDSAPTLVEAGLARFGHLDAAVAASGQIVTGRFLRSSLEDLDRIVAGCLHAPYHFLKAVLPPMTEQRSGQVLVITSAAGARPTPGAPLYSAVRAGATMLTRNVAGEVARDNVQVNAVGTNFMDFPEFLAATGATDPDVRAAVEAQVPLGRSGLDGGVRQLLRGLPRRHQHLHHRPVRRLRRRLGLTLPPSPTPEGGSTACGFRTLVSQLEGGQASRMARSWSLEMTLAPRRREPSATRRSLDATVTGCSTGRASSRASSSSSASTPGAVNRTCTPRGRDSPGSPRPTSAPSKTTVTPQPVRAASASRASMSRRRWADSASVGHPANDTL